MLTDGEFQHVFVDTLAPLTPETDGDAISAAARISARIRLDNVDLRRAISNSRPNNHLAVLTAVIQSRRLMVNRFATTSRAQQN